MVDHESTENRERPLFSIVVPYHDGRPELADAVESVLKQTVTSFELIIANDHSPIHPRDALANPHLDERIRFVDVEESGPGAARNEGIKVSRGEFLTFLDSDDTVNSNWLSTFHMGFGSDVGVVCCGAAIHRPSGTEETFMFPKDLGPAFGGTAGLYLAGTFAYKRDLFGVSLLYDTSLRYSENTEFGMRLARRCRELGQRVHTVSEAPVHLKESDRESYAPHRVAAVERIIAVHGEAFISDTELATDFMAVAGVVSAKQGDWSSAKKWFWDAVKLEPVSFQLWARLIAALIPGVRSRLWVYRNPELRDD